jgi:hypothetical protein
MTAAGDLLGFDVADDITRLVFAPAVPDLGAKIYAVMAVRTR